MKKIHSLGAAMLFLLSGCSPLEEQSLGIIGGADGPTAVVVATRAIEPWEIAAAAAIIAVLVAAVILLIRRRRHK